MPFNWFLLIPILGILCGMLVIYLEHRRKVAMIEMRVTPKGLYKPWYLLIGGLSILGIGLGLLLAFWLFIPKSQLSNLKIAGLSTGLILLVFGIALIISHDLTKEKVMKALVKQLKELKGKNCQITVASGLKFTGTLRDIRDNELLALEKEGTLTYIAIDKVAAVQQIP